MKMRYLLLAGMALSSQVFASPSYTVKTESGLREYRELFTKVSKRYREVSTARRLQKEIYHNNHKHLSHAQAFDFYIKKTFNKTRELYNKGELKFVDVRDEKGSLLGAAFYGVGSRNDQESVAIRHLLFKRANRVLRSEWLNGILTAIRKDAPEARSVTIEAHNAFPKVLKHLRGLGFELVGSNESYAQYAIDFGTYSGSVKTEGDLKEERKFINDRVSPLLGLDSSVIGITDEPHAITQEEINKIRRESFKKTKELFESGEAQIINVRDEHGTLVVAPVVQEIKVGHRPAVFVRRLNLKDAQSHEAQDQLNAVISTIREHYPHAAQIVFPALKGSTRFVSRLKELGFSETDWLPSAEEYQLASELFQGLSITLNSFRTTLKTGGTLSDEKDLFATMFLGNDVGTLDAKEFLNEEESRPLTEEEWAAVIENSYNTSSALVENGYYKAVNVYDNDGEHKACAIFKEHVEGEITYVFVRMLLFDDIHSNQVTTVFGEVATKIAEEHPGADSILLMSRPSLSVFAPLIDILGFEKIEAMPESLEPGKVNPEHPEYREWFTYNLK